MAALGSFKFLPATPDHAVFKPKLIGSPGRSLMESYLSLEPSERRGAIVYVSPEKEFFKLAFVLTTDITNQLWQFE